MKIHPEEVRFNQAKEATADMVLREMHEHVCVGPKPVGMINIPNLPMRDPLEWMYLFDVVFWSSDNSNSFTGEGEL